MGLGSEKRILCDTSCGAETHVEMGAVFGWRYCEGVVALRYIGRWRCMVLVQMEFNAAISYHYV